MQASNLAQAGHAFFALTHSTMNMHGRAAAMVTPIGDKKTLLPAESTVSSSGCAGRGRLKSGSSRKKKWKHARLQGAQRREGVCVASVAEGPSATLPASWSVDLALSVPLGMGPGPKHVGTLTLRSTPQGHPVLSLEYV